MITELYHRDNAVAYAHRWAYSRNPLFYDYENLGGDCTSFVSQCIYAGSGVMNYEETYGWYYIDANQKSPSWTGVPYFYNFMTRESPSVGPFGRPCALWEVRPGDVIQLSFDGNTYQHNLLVVSAAWPYSSMTILVAAHSLDADNRPLETYSYEESRCIHMLGVRKNE